MAYNPDKDIHASSVNAGPPARGAVAVTPSDTIDLSPYAKALYVGVAGNLSVVLAGDKSESGNPVLFSNVPAGWFPVQVRRVNVSNTTASSLVALYN